VNTEVLAVALSGWKRKEAKTDHSKLKILFAIFFCPRFIMIFSYQRTHIDICDE